MPTPLLRELHREFKAGQQERQVAAALKKQQAVNQAADQSKEWRDTFVKEIARLPELLKEAARKGDREIFAWCFTIPPHLSEQDDLYGRMLRAWADTQGVQVTRQEQHEPAARGDPESGEGKHDDRWIVTYGLKW